MFFIRLEYTLVGERSAGASHLQSRAMLAGVFSHYLTPTPPPHTTQEFSDCFLLLAATV